MIYCLAALILLLLVQPAWAQITFIEKQEGFTSPTSTSVTTAAGLTNALSSGDLIVVCSRWSTEGNSQTVTDSAGGVGADYNLIITEPLSTASNAEVAIWYRVLSGAMGSGTTFTVTGAGTDIRRIVVLTYNGFTSATQDGSNSADSGGSVASLAVGAITPGAADALLVACATPNSDTTSWTVDSSYNERTESVNGRLETADRIVSAVASYNPTVTPSANKDIVAVHASFTNGSSQSQAPRSMHQFRIRRQ